ncbi:hypothetical protein [Serinicoccus sp. CUA-874]|uniref:hypothetical protein n=1 Tax=Serinicoccus sp. CUA-874 TaxID=1517939 RepID=UPI001179B79E|nr:hypothetical protein [Serinicoccus sp. CUA-874]
MEEVSPGEKVVIILHSGPEEPHEFDEKMIEYTSLADGTEPLAGSLWLSSETLLTAGALPVPLGRRTLSGVKTLASELGLYDKPAAILDFQRRTMYVASEGLRKLSKAEEIRYDGQDAVPSLESVRQQISRVVERQLLAPSGMPDHESLWRTLNSKKTLISNAEAKIQGLLKTGLNSWDKRVWAEIETRGISGRFDLGVQWRPKVGVSIKLCVLELKVVREATNEAEKAVDQVSAYCAEHEYHRGVVSLFDTRKDISGTPGADDPAVIAAKRERVSLWTWHLFSTAAEFQANRNFVDGGGSINSGFVAC